MQNPNIKGSGYIEHPPQVPFAGRVVMQPSTVNPDDVPEWYAQGAPGYARQHPGNIARAPNGAHRPHQHSLYGQVGGYYSKPRVSVCVNPVYLHSRSPWPVGA